MAFDVGQNSSFTADLQSAGRCPVLADLDFTGAMRRLAAGVSIVAAEWEGRRVGLASTAVASVTTDPPTLLVCVNTSASAHDTVKRAGCFTVNVLAEEDLEVSRLFGSSDGRDRRFDNREWRAMKTGAPALDTALAVFDCRVSSTKVCSTHTIFFGEVVDVRLGNYDGRPLIYWNRDYRRCA